MSKKRKNKAGGGSVLPDSSNVEQQPQDVDVMITGDGEAPEAAPGEPIVINLADGSVEVDLNPQPEEKVKDDKFDANLAEQVDALVLNDITMTLLDAIDEDDRDRNAWLQERADGLDLLGLKFEKPGSNVGATSVAVQGQSTVRDPILAEAIDRFQANAYSELCPAEGPCKAINYGPSTGEQDELAEALEKDFNFYLASGVDGTATEYYEDTRQMLWWVGYASGMFKKVYHCPIRQRPVSESVDGADLIVPSNVTDLRNAGRITHKIMMRQSVMKRMQLLGVYRDVDLMTPNPSPTPLDQKKADLAGVSLTQDRPEDEQYTVYEVYCELDLPGFEHKEKGKPTGLPLPYRVTIEKDSRTILEIRRNWRHDDENQRAKIPFILFPYATGINSIYGTGLLHRLGNPAIALTMMERELIDAGMFASFPGFLFAKPAGRQLQNEFRVPPGGGAPIDVGLNGDIGKSVMPLPYKDPSPALVQMRQQIREEAFRFGNMAEVPVGEGRQDAPVGTTLAMIEQGMKVMSGVLKALHMAQRQELNMLKELFAEDPEALWRNNKRPALGPDPAQRMERWKKALDTCEISPQSDPNVPSDMHRAAKAQMLKQITMGNPAYDQVAVDRRIAKMFKIDDFDSFLAPPQQAQPDPLMVAQVQMKAKELQLKEQSMMMKAQSDQRAIESKEQIAAMQIAAKHGENQDPYKGHEMALKQQALSLQGTKMALDHHDAQADRQSREAIEAMKVATTVGVHPEANQIVDEQLQEMFSFLTPASQNRSPQMAHGGSVEQEILPPDSDVELAVAIAQFLRDHKRRSGY